MSLDTGLDVALNTAIDSCTLALAVLHDHPSTTSSTPPHHPLHSDLLSILALLHVSTTKLSIALKPAAPTFSAALAPLNDTSAHIASLSHCGSLFNPDTHGATLVQEVTTVITDVIHASRSLLQTFCDNHRPTDTYLVKVGTLHEIIDTARSSLSQDNAIAVRKKLAQVHDSLDDGLHEVDDMLADNDEYAEDDSDEDDGWSELGVDSKKRMSGEELERARKAYALLRISTALHKRIMTHILSPSLSIPVQHLDILPVRSSALLVASDDLIAALYPPQHPSDVSAELASYMAVINDLHSSLSLLILTDSMDSMTMQGNTVSTKDPMKWFQACFVQLRKAADNLNLSSTS